MAKKRRDGEPPAPPTPAREAVLKHLRTAALTGAGLALACSGGPAKGDSPTTASDTGRIPPAERPDEPPMVCDPLPPPINCDHPEELGTLQSVVGREAQWVETEKGLGVRVTVTLWSQRQPGAATFEEGAEVTGGTLLSAEREPERFIAVFVPSETGTTVRLLLHLRCETRTIPLALSVELPAKGQAGQSMRPEIVAP